MIPIVRMFRAKGTDRIAVISVQSAWAHPGASTIQVVRGARRTALIAGTTYGPFADKDLGAQHSLVISSLESEGFAPAGRAALFSMLDSGDSGERARAALRLGWRQDRSAVPKLLALAAQQTEELSSVIDSLGRIADPRAIEVCRAEAARKLLSRRRSGAEALRNLGDSVGLAELRARAMERLPDEVRKAVVLTESTPGPEATLGLCAAVSAVVIKDRGLAIDTLYELGTPSTLTAVRSALSTVKIGQPFIWRYARSVFKRAMLRGDAQTFAELAHAIEIQSRGHVGAVATFKSGLDGSSKTSMVFKVPTQRYARRLAWRWLRLIARWRPADYAAIAAASVCAYVPADATAVKGLHWEWSNTYLFQRVLFGASERFVYDHRKMRFRFKSSKATQITQGTSGREESFPELWDQSPGAYLTVLAGSKVLDAQNFALKSVLSRHPLLLQRATNEQLLSMLNAPLEGTVQLAVAELERRFNALTTDYSLIASLLRDARPFVSELGRKWLVATSEVWTSHIDRVMELLGLPDALGRAVAAGLVIASLDAHDAWFKRELCEKILTVLQGKEPTAGAHEGYSRVARDGLASELSAMLSLSELIAMVNTGSASAQSVGASLLGRNPDAVAALGIARITAMGLHPVFTVRAASHHLLRAAIGQLQSDPSILFTLCECEWRDSREFALELLRTKIDLAALGIDGLVGLCDSNRTDVQDLGRSLVLRHFDALDAHELIYKLSQHPHPNMRRFALDLVTGHLREGFVALAKLEGFFRSAIFDLWPSRNEKRAVLEFLTQRGLRDEGQAELASRLLAELARTKVKSDAELAMQSLVRIKLAFPDVDSAIKISHSGVA